MVTAQEIQDIETLVLNKCRKLAIEIGEKHAAKKTSNGSAKGAACREVADGIRKIETDLYG